MSGEFLSRWSRRKLEERRAEDAPIAPPEPGGETAESLPQVSPADAEITPEEIAALPPVDEITPETDITAFLRKGVPEFLKNAALRRVWSLDPKIRDYVSEAREYAYDWNVPGGVPGNGPLEPTDNVGAMLEQIFGKPKPEAMIADAEPRDASSQMRDLEPPFDEAENAAMQHPAESESAELGIAPPGGDAVEHAAEAPLHAALPNEPEPMPLATPSRRRHGGARPA